MLAESTGCQAHRQAVAAGRRESVVAEGHMLGGSRAGTVTAASKQAS